MSINVSQLNTTNYLVPAAGQTHAMKYDGVFSGVPYSIDWRQFRIDNFPFQPQGVYIDNTQGTGDLTILILPINYSVVCGAGQTLEAQFPAPNGQTCQITGNGQASVIFVDYPVLPSGAQVSLKGTANVSLTAIPTTDILNVQMAPLAQGAVPYQVLTFPVPATAKYFAIAPAATTGNVTPPANSNLRRVLVSLTGDAAIAAAGNITLTLTLNGTQILKKAFYVPAAASGIDKTLCDLTFDNMGLNVGAAGTLVATLSAALVSGTVECNSYFTS